MPLYRKKPVVIEARQVVDLDSLVSVADWVSGSGVKCDQWPDHLDIHTLEGVMRADLGDYVIRGVKGEFYPCKLDIFEATYEPVPPPQSSDEDRIQSALTEAQEHPGRIVTR